MSLDRYKDKRDFDRSPEPEGSERAEGSEGAARRFVVQKHAARRTHFDLRLEIGGTLVEMARVLDDDVYRESILPEISNSETKRFLQRLSAFRKGMREQKVASTLHRLQRFLGTPFVRNIVGQARSTINFRQVMDERKVLLFDLAEVEGEEAQ